MGEKKINIKFTAGSGSAGGSSSFWNGRTKFVLKYSIEHKNIYKSGYKKASKKISEKFMHFYIIPGFLQIIPYHVNFFHRKKVLFSIMHYSWKMTHSLFLHRGNINSFWTCRLMLLTTFCKSRNFLDSAFLLVLGSDNKALFLCSSLCVT